MKLKRKRRKTMKINSKVLIICELFFVFWVPFRTSKLFLFVESGTHNFQSFEFSMIFFTFSLNSGNHLFSNRAFFFSFIVIFRLGLHPSFEDLDFIVGVRFFVLVERSLHELFLCGDGSVLMDGFHWPVSWGFSVFF